MNSMRSEKEVRRCSHLELLLFRLKRRLEQYEHDRQVERVHANRLQAKREADIEARLRKDRVCIDLREIRLDIR